MIKVYKLRIYSQDVNIEKFNINCGIRKFIYNLFIIKNKTNYENGEKFLGYMEFEKWLNHEFLLDNPEYKWIKNASQKNLKDGMRCAEIAFKRFFKTKEGYPNYKRKRDNVSFYFVNDNHIKVERHRIKIPIFGWLRIYEYGYLPKNCKILSGNLVKEANNFYICLRVEIKETEIDNFVKSTDGVGVDLGLKEFAVVSDGRVFENINKTSTKIKKLEKKIKHLNKELSRRLGKKKSKKEREKKFRRDESYKKQYKKLSKEEKKKLKKESMYSFDNKRFIKKEIANKKTISKNALKTIAFLQKTYYKLTRIRTEYVRSVVNSLVKLNPKFITVENLNIKGLVKNYKLAKSILNSKWGYFKEFLEYQCKKKNIELIKANTFYPSSKTCSRCGCKKKSLKLSERTYVCFHCGNEIDRDLNASLNLKYLGLTGEFTPNILIR